MLTVGFFRLLISLILLILIVYILRKTNKKKDLIYIRQDVRHGEKCYGCKCQLHDDYLKNLLSNFAPSFEDLTKKMLNDVNLSLCKACSRDMKLNSLSNILIKCKNYKYYLNRYLYANNVSTKFILFMVIMCVSFIILNVFLKIVLFFYLYNIILYLQWYLIYKSFKLDYTKKES